MVRSDYCWSSRNLQFVEQGQYQPLAMEVQVPIIYAGVNGLVSVEAPVRSNVI